MTELHWPQRDYLVQIARFDPAKGKNLLYSYWIISRIVSLGIPDVISSYYKFRNLLKAKSPELSGEEHPQLLLCGHGAVDDPDASIIYDQVIQLIASEPYNIYSKDIIVMRLPPSDQRMFFSPGWSKLSFTYYSVLNALMSNSRIALQLSTREGFEVKVSEALHAGKPVIAYRTGGIPLQIEDGKSGYLITPGDHEAVAKHLYELYTDEALYREMSQYARTHVSDEVGTVGNAAAWLYLAVMYHRGIKIKPNGAWLNDMLRAETGEEYVAGEPRLPRGGLQMRGWFIIITFVFCEGRTCIETFRLCLPTLIVHVNRCRIICNRHSQKLKFDQ